MPTKARVELSQQQRRELEKLTQSPFVSVRVARRARMILLAADGLSELAIGAGLGVRWETVGRHCQRFIEMGIAGLEDALRPNSPKRRISAEQVEQIIRLTTQERPPKWTHWTSRGMAQASGVSEASVRRIWKRYGLTPPLFGEVESPLAESLFKEYLVHRDYWDVDRLKSAGTIDYYKEVSHFEIRLVAWALAAANNNRNRAARLLGLSKEALRSRVKELQAFETLSD